jgi:two-component system, LytTR family, response regulator
MKLVKTTSIEQTARRIPIFIPNLPIIKKNKTKQGYRKIALPTMEGIHFKKVEEIVSLEAKGNYTNLHFTNGKKLLVCKTLRKVEKILNAGNQFIRIHRSFTINLNLLQKYIKGKGGYVVMEDKSNIRVSTGKKQDFLRAVEIYFGG